ncbi:unnamed protein product [Ambrosiozyma monospora]|uniref:Unnamed protein product n=1 Tax=Ambrosiozyma monospora TaxID=43982 RepID=A0ACB5U8S8_AMBMO|nr:unnamed protein product [Ambrosiozyma monospora]
MGRELIAIESAPAGSIVGIGGLEGKVLKSGTLVSPGVLGVNLAGINLNTQPIVKVALEPVNPTHMDRLVRGLELLNLADPCVQTYVQDTGEHILATAGELHLERCLKDLKERFAGVDITASKPDIPYRETIVAADMNPAKNPELGRGTVNIKLDKYVITMETRPLPNDVTVLLLNNVATLSNIARGESKVEVEAEKDDNGEAEDEEEDEEEVVVGTTMSIDDFKSKLKSAFGSGNSEFKAKENIDWSQKDLLDRYIQWFSIGYI